MSEQNPENETPDNDEELKPATPVAPTESNEPDENVDDVDSTPAEPVEVSPGEQSSGTTVVRGGKEYDYTPEGGHRLKS